MTGQSGQAVIEGYYEALAARDTTRLHEILSPQIVVTYHAGVDRLPWAGRFEGIDGFDEFLGLVASHCEVVTVTQHGWIIDGDSVVVPCTGHWRVPATNSDVHASMVNIFTMSDGQISRYDVHADTDAFVTALAGEPR